MMNRIIYRLKLLLCTLILLGCAPNNQYLGWDVDMLIGELNAQQPETRAQVAYALADMGPKAAPAIPKLVEALFDTDQRVRVAAREALVAIGPESTVPLFTAMQRSIEQNADENVTTNIMEGLFSLTEDSIQGLIAIFKENPPGSAERAAVVSILDEITVRRGTDAIGACSILISALDDPWKPTQLVASRALSRLGTEVIDDLIVALTSTSTDTRYHAAEILGGMGSSAGRAGPALVNALEDKDPVVRMAAKAALDEIGVTFEYSPSVSQHIEDLITSLRDPNPNIRAEAAYDLGNLGPQATLALSALRLAQDDPDARVRSAATLAIMKIETIP
jgi:HEAT repeat protein